MKRRIFNRRPKDIHDCTTTSTIGTRPSKPTSASSSSSPLPIFYEHVKTHQTIHYRRKKRQTRVRMMQYCFTFLFIACVILYITKITSWHTQHKLQQESIHPSSTTNTTTTWPHETIHILNTRFMQHQPHLPTLAQARLHLFQTICLPSILHQTFVNFLWIIKIDPDLDVDIRNKLVELIKTSMLSNRIFVVGSNVNYLTGHTKGGWRGGLESFDILRSKIYTGDIQLLQQASKASDEKIVLETRLDADDGLHKNYLELVERDAKLKFRSGKYDFHYWCMESHIKWYIGDNGSQENTTDYPQGMVEGERRPNFCMTPGLTIGMNVGYDVMQLPLYPHHELYRKLKNECLNDGEDHSSIHSNTTTTDTNNNHECITFINKIVSAVRSRTETSAGMEEVSYTAPTEKETNKLRQQVTLWSILSQHFGISKENAIQTKKYFIENRIEIARENLLGQCLGDHSCKNSTKIRLQKIIDGVV
ncbi:hypothetical protein CTEN210_11945 [Chaetoceros tenuissimus]|uniref:Uncharacterized protein n=1 Tax=Chaetoceros tenuissimus TaxID=426638 RepID=A0AAD3D3M2_9STRA|nr:hypothetical protein CTEN210_11945 [Chaetoceros tenuissimus]